MAVDIAAAGIAVAEVAGIAVEGVAADRLVEVAVPGMPVAPGEVAVH
jgi:hypothetical protein